MRGKYQQSLNKSKFNQSYIRHHGKNDRDDSDENRVNAIKEQVTTINKNSTPVKSNNQRSGKSKNQISKANPEKKSHIKVIADSILNVIHERHEQR